MTERFAAREARSEAASAILLMLVFMVLLISCWVVFFVCVYCSTLVGVSACFVACLFAACVRGLRHACGAWLVLVGARECFCSTLARRRLRIGDRRGGCACFLCVVSSAWVGRAPSA